MGQLDKLLKESARQNLEAFDEIWDEFEGATAGPWNEEAIAVCNALPIQQLKAWREKHSTRFKGGVDDRVVCTDKTSSYYKVEGRVINANESYCTVSFDGRGVCEKRRRHLKAVT